MSAWQEEWVEPSQEMLEEAWKWMLVQSPCGTSNLLCVLRTVMEKMLINYSKYGTAVVKSYLHVLYLSVCLSVSR